MKTEIVVVESYELVLLGIETAIAQTRDMHVAGIATDMSRAERLIRGLRPDLCILSADLPDGKGLPLLATAAYEGLHTRFVMLGSPCRAREVFQAMSHGATGFIDAHDPTDRIFDYLRRASKGLQVLSDAAQRALLSHLQKNERRRPGTTHASNTSGRHLSVRELQVLQCAAEGLSIADTASRLHMSTATVKNHRQHIFVRLDVPNIPAAIFWATRNGMLR